MADFDNDLQKSGWTLSEINERAKMHPEEFILEAEATFASQIRETVDKIEERRPDCKILMVSGPSSSGKTTTANMIKDELMRRDIWSTVISLDDFYVGIARLPLLKDGGKDFESINGLDIEQVKKSIKGIVYEGFCDMPIYDFSTMAPSSERRQIKLPENGVIIIEGLHALNPVITEGLPLDSVFKIYVSVENEVQLGGEKVIQPTSIRLTRRVLRDFYFRDTEAVRTILMWNNVCRGENLYIKPLKEQSNVSLNSFHAYELCIMGTPMIEQCASVTGNLDVYEAIKRLGKKLDMFERLDKSLVPQTSLLKEFLK